MNTNLLAIVKQIIAEQGEAILDNPQRLKAFFADYAKDEPKKERQAFGRCVEMGSYAELKSCGSVEERQYKKSRLADTLHKNTGIDRPYCADALDLLEVVIFGEQEKNLCKNCGKEMQVGWKSCPFCEIATADTQRKGKKLYYLSYDYKETGPYDRAAIKTMAANGQITADYFARADDSEEWKPVTTLCKFSSIGASHHGSSHVAQDARRQDSSPPLSASAKTVAAPSLTPKSESKSSGKGNSSGKSGSKDTLIAVVVGIILFVLAFVLVDIFFGFLTDFLDSSGIGDVLDDFFRRIIHGD